MKFERTSAVILSATLVFSVLAVFISGLWPIAAAQTVFFLLALACSYRAATARERLPQLVYPLAAAVLWGLLQLLFDRSVYRFGTWSGVLRFAAYLCAFFVSLQVFRFPDIRRRFRLGAIYFGCLLGAEAIIQRFTSGGKIFWMLGTENTLRAMGPFVNPDHYCAFIELIFPLALWQAITDRARTFQFAVIAAVLFASVVTGASRAGFLLTLAEVVFVLVFTRKVSRRIVAAIVALICVFGFVVGWGGLLDRFKEPEQFNVRWQLWLSSFRMLEDRPGMGFGLGSWETVYPRYAVFDPGVRADHAHSDWLEWADEGGLPFAGMLLVLAVASVRMAVRYPWGVGVAAVFFHSAVDFPLQEPAIFFSLLALLAALVRDVAREFRRQPA
ncbi:MAG: O-antigen ligase family protein [Acidobacteriota bacterium]|nr:O-antigen ligase family protein [Acidobacteriota bacterium]